MPNDTIIHSSEKYYLDWGYSEAGLELSDCSEKKLINSIQAYYKSFKRSWNEDIIDLRKFPSNKDKDKDYLIMENWSKKVYDQEGNHSCVAAALADSVLRWNFIRHQYIKPDEKLSIRFLWMAAKEIDEFTNRPTSFIEKSGTSLKAALKIVKKYGIVSDVDLPNKNLSRLYKGDENSFYVKAAKFKIESYFNLAKVNKNNENINISENWDRVKCIWLGWLSKYHSPILIKLNIDQSWNNIKEGDTTIDDYHPDEEGRYYQHAAAIIGYKFAEKEFIIRNTAGNKWGDKGYICMHEDYAKEAIKEAYGIKLFKRNIPAGATPRIPCTVRECPKEQ